MNVQTRRRMWLFRALVIAAPLTALHVLAMALVASVVGARPVDVRIFAGPSLVARRERPRVRIGALPFGSYVAWRMQEDTSTDPTAFDRLARWRRALVILSGNVLLVAIAALALGPLEAGASFVRAFAQLAWLFVDPSRAVDVLRGFAEVSSPIVLVGVLSAKLAAYNLLPIGGLNGEALSRLVVPEARWPWLDRTWRAGSAMVSLAIAIAIVVAIVRV